MKTNRFYLRHFLPLLYLSALLVLMNACSKKEENIVDPDNPGTAVAGNYSISYYNANGTEYDPAKVGPIGTISVASSGKEFVEVDQVLTIKNTNIYNPFPTSMRIVKSGGKSVLLQTFDNKPIGTIDDGTMEIKLVETIYTTTIRAKRLYADMNAVNCRV